MKFTKGMAVPKQQGTSLMCDSFIKTRRINQTQSFLLEERLKALDCRKSQKNAEFDAEKHSLRKQMQEIKTVKKNLGISVERRKLLRSQGYTIDARAAQHCEDAVAIKKYSTPELTRVSSPRPTRTSVMSSSEFTLRGLSQLSFQDEGEGEKEIANGETSKDQIDGVPARSRARHQFRVIEPPCRPGSRRNFVQISSDKLKQLKEKEDEKSGETLFDPSLKVDHRGMIMSPRLANTLRKNSQTEIEEGEDSLIMQPRGSCEGFIQRKQICPAKQTKAVYSLRPSSAEVIPLCLGEQAYAKKWDFEDKVLLEEQSKNLISMSCESLDRMTEVQASDRSPDCQGGASRQLIRSGSACPENRTAVGKVTRAAHSALEPRRKHATCGNRSPVRVAFVEPQNGTTSGDNPAINKHSFAVTESRQPKVNQEHGPAIEFRDGLEQSFNPDREKSPQLQKKVGPVRRVTLPSGVFNAVQSKDLVKSHVESNKEKKRMSVASYSPNIQKSKTNAFSSQPERGRPDNAVTYAYDARPGRSLCKGYITMQMTVKGKQVKVHIPKFPHDSDSQPALERARKKVADDRLQSKMLQETGQPPEEEQKSDHDLF